MGEMIHSDPEAERALREVQLARIDQLSDEDLVEHFRTSENGTIMQHSLREEILRRMSPNGPSYGMTSM